MKHLLFFSFLFLFNICRAQFPDYYVYLVKGDVTVSDKKGKHLVKQGDFLYKTDALSFGNHAEVTLTNKEADYFVLNSGNNPKLTVLATKDAGSYTGITKKYLDLVWDEVLDPNYNFTKFKSKNLTGVYGGVVRGESCRNMIFPVSGLKTSVDSLHFTWLKTSVSGNYNFSIYDGGENEVLHRQVKDTQLIINVSQSGLTAGKYYWLIKSDDATCEDEVSLYFQVLTKEEENNLLASIVPATGNDSLTNELEIIDKLEKKAFIYAAKSHYENAIKNNPGNQALRQMYAAFLLNYGFDDEAAKVWTAAQKM